MQRKHLIETVDGHALKNRLRVHSQHEMVTVCISKLPEKNATEESE